MRQGMIKIKRGMIAYIEVHEPDSREVIYEPDPEDISKLCDDHNFDYQKLTNLIARRAPEIYGILIVGEKFRKTDVIKTVLSFRNKQQGVRKCYLATQTQEDLEEWACSAAISFPDTIYFFKDL